MIHAPLLFEGRDDMNRIDKLILRARAAAAPGLELGAALIERDGDSWAAVVHLHNLAKVGPPTVKRATWATLERAVEYVRSVAEEYPNSKDLTVIIDDLG